MKPLALLVCLGFLLSAPRIFAQTDPAKSAGFKEFRLGMTRTQVDSVIASSEWRHFRLPKTHRNVYDTTSVFLDYFHGSLDGNGPERKTRDSIGEELFSIGCEIVADYSYCKEARDIVIDFYNDRVLSVRLSYDVSAKHAGLINSWAETAQQGLTARYGRPDQLNKAFARLDDDDMVDLPHGQTTIAVWSLSKKKYSSPQTVQLHAYHSSYEGADFPFSVTVLILDDNLLKQQNADIAAKAKAAPKPKVRSGF